MLLLQESVSQRDSTEASDDMENTHLQYKKVTNITTYTVSAENVCIFPNSASFQSLHGSMVSQQRHAAS